MKTIADMQMSKHTFCTAALISLIAVLPGISGQLPTPVSAEAVLPAMPAAVRQTILGEAKPDEIEDCEQTTEDGELVYEVSYLRDSVERSFTVALDGTLRSRQCFRKELPPMVQQAIAKLEEHSIVGDIYWCNEDGDLVYEVETGKRFRTFSLDGLHLATQQFIDELPGPAQKTIREQACSNPILSIARDETEVDEIFDAVLLRNGQRRIISINAAGAVVATQINLVQTPAAVQHTITQTAGTAHIIYIGQCKEEGAISFVVVTYQGIRRDEFVVETDGKLHSHVVSLAQLPETAQKFLRITADGARIARIEKLTDGTFEADLDRYGKKQILMFSADSAVH